VINQPTILHVKIPLKLACMVAAMRKKVNRYETNRYLKNIAAFLVLKSVTPYGVITNYSTQTKYLCSICQCTRQTLSKRLQWLQDEGLLVIEGADIRLKSWKQVATLYNLNLKQFKTIIYDCANDKNVYLQLLATEIEVNKEHQAYIIKSKLEKNLALKRAVQYFMLRHGADQTKLNDLQYLHNGMKHLYRRSFIAEPETHALLNTIRPDTNRSVKGIAAAWDCKSPQTVSYYKAKLAASGYAVIHKGERVTSHTRARNELCHTIWNNKKKQTVLCLVDAIELTVKTVAA
jgi:hypothetical protein